MSNSTKTGTPATTTGSRLRALAAKAALFAFSFTLALGVAEVATRLLCRPVRGVSWYHNDPRYGVKHRPGVDRITTEWGERTPWRFRTNSRGFRWPEWGDAPAPGVSRVLVMGDSFTFGNAVEVEQAFPAVADAALRRTGSWEVINAGVSGWGPQNALAYLESEGAPIRGSCLVYAFYEGNDVMDAYVHPLYELRGGELVHLPAPKQMEGRAATARSLMRAFPAYELLLEHSQLFNMARNLFIQRTVWQAAKDAVTAGADDPDKPRPETFAKSLTETLATLDRLAALGRERFGGFALVTIPFREAALRGRGAPQPPERTPEWVAVRSHEAVVDWARARGVPLIDMGERLPAEPAGIKALYFSVDFHFGVAGNRALGELVAERIPGACPARPR